jgi:hypothetical protein
MIQPCHFGLQFADILQASHTSIDPPSKIIGLHDTDGTSRPFVAEAFFNQ